MVSVQFVKWKDASSRQLLLIGDLDVGPSPSTMEMAVSLISMLIVVESMKRATFYPARVEDTSLTSSHISHTLSSIHS